MRRAITAKRKRDFIRLSECVGLQPHEIRYQYVNLYDAKTLVLSINVDCPEKAERLWQDRAILVSSARETDISRYVLINFAGFPYGFVMLSREDLSPEPMIKFNIPRMPKLRKIKI